MESRVKSCTNCERRKRTSILRVYVDVDFVVGHFEKSSVRGKRCWGECCDGFVDGVEDEAIADESAIDEDVDAVAIGALDFGARGEAVNGETRFFFGGFELGLSDGARKAAETTGFRSARQRIACRRLVDALGEALDGEQSTICCVGVVRMNWRPGLARA